MSSISEKLVEKISTGLGILRWYSIIINRSTQPTLLAFDSALATDHREYNRYCITVYFLNLVTFGNV